ncbi:MAG: family 1 glycosylhydrolase [Anaerolineales bacterium]|nr:family 1 glycosylhydrolase [Anaerolineales bacterium]
MAPATWAFPEEFLWGTATASVQVEGDNANSDRWLWEPEPDRMRHGDRSGKPCDWWGGRWAEDFDRAAACGQNAHRRSIEWSRIEPSLAKWEAVALAYYREILHGAVDRGLRPIVTLHHFTNPQWLAEHGAWLDAEASSLFARTVHKVVSCLRDLADLWIMLDKLNVLAHSGYAPGVFPPGVRNLNRAFPARVHRMQVHAAAYPTICALRTSARMGLARHVRGMLPERPACPLDTVVTWARSTTSMTCSPERRRTAHSVCQRDA